MKYTSVNEIDTLSLADSLIVRCIYSKKQELLEFEIKGAVVRENNSANDTYTDRYVSDMQLRFIGLNMEALLLEGHSYYDANDTLIETVPDKPVDEDCYEQVLKCFEGNLIFFAGRPKENKDLETGRDKACYQMIVDVEEESYVLSFYYDKVTASWEHFMNKA
ncbi:MAG: hypothetical protein J6A82_02340 [Coprococcus sp.]|nr:hypothetical protein [Coprococcus sp.]